MWRDGASERRRVLYFSGCAPRPCPPMRPCASRSARRPCASRSARRPCAPCVADRAATTGPKHWSAGLDWIDDEIGLFDERPVAVADLWRALMSSILGEGGGPVLIVHPTWWPRARSRGCCAGDAGQEVRAVSRPAWSSRTVGTGPVIEIAAEFVAVCGAADAGVRPRRCRVGRRCRGRAARFTPGVLGRRARAAGSAQTAEDIRAACRIVASPLATSIWPPPWRPCAPHRLGAPPGLVTTLLVAVALIALGGAVSTTMAPRRRGGSRGVCEPGGGPDRGRDPAGLAR